MALLLFSRLDLIRDVLRNRAAALRVRTDKSYRQLGQLRDKISPDRTPLHIFTGQNSNEMNKGGTLHKNKIID
jgi:hypothetical protein